MSITKYTIFELISFPGIITKYTDDNNGIRVYEDFCANVERKLTPNDMHEWSELYVQVIYENSHFRVLYGIDKENLQEFEIEYSADLLEFHRNIQQFINVLKRESECIVKIIQIENDFKEN